jgi:hypothetical protein
MPFIPFNGCVRSTLLYVCDGQILANTLHFVITPPITLTQMNNLNTALHTWYTASLKPQLTAAIALTGINTIDLTTVSSPGAFLPISPIEPGTAGGSPLPANVSWVSTLRTGLRGRAYRGRWYHPTIAAGYQTGVSAITAGAVAAIQAALAQLLTPANVANFTWAVASRFLNKLPRATGVTTSITSVAGDLTLDSQRRRLPGRGA